MSSIYAPKCKDASASFVENLLCYCANFQALYSEKQEGFNEFAGIGRYKIRHPFT